MNKQHILNEIKRTDEANGRAPLGKRRFFQETAIKDTDWRGERRRAEARERIPPLPIGWLTRFRVRQPSFRRFAGRGQKFRESGLDIP